MVRIVELSSPRSRSPLSPEMVNSVTKGHMYLCPVMVKGRVVTMHNEQPPPASGYNASVSVLQQGDGLAKWPKVFFPEDEWHPAGEGGRYAIP